MNVLEQATDLNAINPPQNVSVKAKVEKEIFMATLTILFELGPNLINLY